MADETIGTVSPLPASTKIPKFCFECRKQGNEVQYQRRDDGRWHCPDCGDAVYIYEVKRHSTASSNVN